MKRSPFPGMDPFLESRWPEVHASLIVYSRNQINSHLPDDLQANIEENLAVYAEDCSDRNIRLDAILFDYKSNMVGSILALLMFQVTDLFVCVYHSKRACRLLTTK